MLPSIAFIVGEWDGVVTIDEIEGSSGQHYLLPPRSTYKLSFTPSLVRRLVVLKGHGLNLLSLFNRYTKMSKEPGIVK